MRVLILGGTGEARALADAVARMARDSAQRIVGDGTRVDVLVVDRAGAIVGESA